MTYLELKELVATQLNRPDMLTPIPPSTIAVIPKFIQDRIAHYQRALYAPSEVLDYSITCIPNQVMYPLPRGTQAVRGVRLLLTNIWIPLTRADWYWDILLNDVLSPPLATLPSYWCIRGGLLRLYPGPGAPYPLELMSNKSPPAPINDTDDNFWTQEEDGAGTLIACAATSDIFRRVINNVARAGEMDKIVARETQTMVEWTQRMNGPMRVRAYL